MKKGKRYELLFEFWAYPHAIVPVGTTGVVTNFDNQGCAWVKLDTEIEGLEDWDNELQVDPEHFEDFKEI